MVVLVTGGPGVDAGPPLDFDDGSALNPNTKTIANTAIAENHAKADRREDAGFIVTWRTRRTRTRRDLLLARIKAMAIASSAETADESSGSSSRICSERMSRCSGTVGHVSPLVSSRRAVVRAVNLE